MDEFKEGLNDIIRPPVMLFTFVYLVLICHPCFLLSEEFLWVMIVDDWAFMGWWIVMLLWYCVIIVAVWMFIMHKMGLWE